jgi:glyoxylase-like metal-dependent hydrolase (beta-lactamase superfamily II)
LPGITMIRSSGHTRGHAVIALESPDGIELGHLESIFMFAPRRMLFAGDVCPTRHNVRMVFQTAYDTFPLDTRAWKRETLAAIAREHTLLMFDHDPDLFGATIKPHPKKEYVIDKTLHVEVSGHEARPLEELEANGRFRPYRDEPFISG